MNILCKDTAPKLPKRSIRYIRNVHAALCKRYLKYLLFREINLNIISDYSGYQGCVCFNENTGVVDIQILDSDNLEHVLGVLVHEWAHVLTFFTPDCGGVSDHGPDWGVKYAEVFREVYEERPARLAKRKKK